MEDRSHAVIAILFLLVLGVGSAALVMWMESGPARTGIYEIVSPYDVGGLSAAAPVWFKGVEVGTVKSVELDPEQKDRVRIVIALVPGAPVTHSTYASVGSEGLAGTKYVALDDSGTSDEPLETSSRHPARIPARRGLLQSAEHSGQELLDELDQVVERVDALLDPSNRAHLADALAGIDRAAQRLASLEAALRPAVERLPRIAEETSRTLAESRDLVAQLREDARVLHETGRSADEATRRFATDTLPRLDELLRHLDRATRQVDALARELRREPQSVIFGGEAPAPGPGEPGFEAPAPQDAP